MTRSWYCKGCDMTTVLVDDSANISCPECGAKMFRVSECRHFTLAWFRMHGEDIKCVHDYGVCTLNTPSIWYLIFCWRDKLPIWIFCWRFIETIKKIVDRYLFIVDNFGKILSLKNKKTAWGITPLYIIDTLMQNRMIFWNLVQFRAIQTRVSLGSINEWLYACM